MTSHQLRCFVAVAERLSFTAAAESLYMAQSTLSRQIALLEEEFGTPFFVRDKSGLRLTQAGEIFYEEAKTTLVREQQLRQRLENAANGKPERLRIGVMEEKWPPDVFCNAVSELHRAYPDIELIIRPLHVHDIRMQMESGAVDMVFANDHTVAMIPDAVTIPLMTEQMFLAAGETYPLVENGTLPLSCLDEVIARREYMVLEPSVFGAQMAPQLRELLGRSMTEAQLEQIRFMVSDAEMTMQTVCGLGVTMVHQSHRLCSAPGIVLTPLSTDAPPLQLVLAYRAGSSNPAVPIFANLVRKLLPGE